MADDGLISRVQGLSDLELALLICLATRENCIISTPAESSRDLVDELQRISSRTFGLVCVELNCNPNTTLDEFAAAILVPSPPVRARSVSPFQSRSSPAATRRTGISPLTSTAPPLQIANVILAKDLDKAPREVQIQALELLRTRRIFTRTAVQAAPKQFLFIPVLSAARAGEARLVPHLNDFFFIAHWHDPDDGFAYLDFDGGDDADTSSTSSVVKKSISEDTFYPGEALLTELDISEISEQSHMVQVDVEIIRYQMNIISHLRLHRAVGGGISSTATKHFDELIRCLAFLHNLDYVTPALVSLAAQKIYMHRIKIVKPENERSTQWGSHPQVVKALLEGVGPEDVIEDVLNVVTAPV